MQLNVVFIATAFLASASLAMSATITGTAFDGADCTGTQGKSFTMTAFACFNLESNSTKSISYSGVPNEIDFFIPNGIHSFCTSAPTLRLGSGSGCGTAPDG